MSQVTFNHPFVYCGVCHRRYSPEDPLKLTSCAHILCSMHVNDREVCPICDTTDISFIKLVQGKNLPNDVSSFFEPLPQLLESIYNVSQFQQQNLINQIQYYQNHCVKLREKVARQQQLLYKAKQELDTVSHLKSRITELESQLQDKQINSITGSNFFDSNRRNSSKMSYTRDSIQPPMTVDLTIGDELIEQDNFVSKLKRTSSLRNNIQKNSRRQSSNGKETSNLTGLKYQNGKFRAYTEIGDLGSIDAESTQLNKFGYSPTNLQFTKGVENSNIPTLTSLSSSSMSPGHSSITYSSSNGYNNQNNNNNNDKNNQSKFPLALDKLRIAKRNNTTNNETGRSISNSQGITSHMRSSEGIHRSRNPNFSFSRRSSTSQLVNGKFPHSSSSNDKFTRIK